MKKKISLNLFFTCKMRIWFQKILSLIKAADVFRESSGGRGAAAETAQVSQQIGEIQPICCERNTFVMS